MEDLFPEVVAMARELYRRRSSDKPLPTFVTFGQHAGTIVYPGRLSAEEFYEQQRAGWAEVLRDKDASKASKRRARKILTELADLNGGIPSLVIADRPKG